MHFDDPKGFSSFTMAVRPRLEVEPAGVLYRHLENKDNAILDFESEKRVFLLLGEHGIAARCHHYDHTCRIEQLYHGRTLEAVDLEQDSVLRGIADQLYRFHQIEPQGLPHQGFFELLHRKWGTMARRVLERECGRFPAEERELCDRLREIYSESTLERALALLPQGPLTFCHNDTYHGNVMELSDGSIRLLDFEFSCLNHIVFDFANLFAETVMRHGQQEPPHFHIAEPEYGHRDIDRLIGFYLDNACFDSEDERATRQRELAEQTERALPLSDLMYALAALPLALEPIQKIRFIPYAHQRFQRFLAASG